MTTWNFQVRLNREPTEAEFDALYQAGLSDTGIEGSLIDVDREAPSVLQAVASVAQQIRTVPGLRAVGIETQDSVTLTDAAQRLGRRTAESLRLLAEGKRGPGGFPSPSSIPANFGCTLTLRSRRGYEKHLARTFPPPVASWC